MATFYAQFDYFEAFVRTFSDPDFSPVMKTWEGLIVEGNRRGVLSGMDGFDRPMPPLKYRGGAGKRTAIRRGGKFGTTAYAGRTEGATSAAYSQATGPRLAPFFERSRVIANLETTHGRLARAWYAIGAWRDVVSKKGVPFLHYHFDGMGRNPRYDLRPVRKAERQKARTAMLAYVALLQQQARNKARGMS